MKLIAYTVLMAAAVAAAAADPSIPPQVHIRAGTLQGTATSDVIAYKGIPYAEPPIGDLRWRPPVLVHAWKGVRAANEYGHACLQPPQQPTGLRAISQSGYMPTYRALHDDTLGLQSAEAGGKALAAAAGASDAASLRGADLTVLFKAGLATGWQPEPVIDGVVLTRQLAETFFRGEQAKVPVIAGFNEGEIRSLLFLMPKAPDSQSAYEADVRRRFGDEAPAYLAVYPGLDPKADVMASVRDGIYGWAAQNLGRQQAAVGQPAYLYLFRHSSPHSPLKRRSFLMP
jgi:carboxylesterase type B